MLGRCSQAWQRCTPRSWHRYLDQQKQHNCLAASIVTNTSFVVLMNAYAQYNGCFCAGLFAGGDDKDADKVVSIKSDALASLDKQLQVRQHCKAVSSCRCGNTVRQ